MLLIIAVVFEFIVCLALGIQLNIQNSTDTYENETPNSQSSPRYKYNNNTIQNQTLPIILELSTLNQTRS